MSLSYKGKNVEFANLFELFDKLATRRSRALRANELDLDELEAIPVPRDLQPVFRNLASLVGPRRRGHRRAIVQEKSSSNTKTRSRRNTVASPSPDKEDDADTEDDEKSAAEFPLQGKSYAFTFKMMLHKLYELEEWGQKVKDVLEKSQMQYKSLADANKKENVQKEGEKDGFEGKREAGGRVHFAPGTTAGGRRGSIPVLHHRPRSISISGANRFKDIRRGPLSPISPKKPVMQQSVVPRDDTRAVKRRCVGRRKSMNALREDGEAQFHGGWVYDSAASSIEANAQGSTRRRRLSSTAKPPPFAGFPRAPTTAQTFRGRRSLSVGVADLLVEKAPAA